MKIIDNQLEIKLGQFTQEEFDVVLTKIKNRKAASLEEIQPEVWKARKFDDLLLRYCKAVYKRNTMKKRLHPSLSRENWTWNHQQLLGHNPYFHSG